MKVFLSYSHSDEDYKEDLEKHLSLLKRQGLISVWNDRRIVPGEDWSSKISENLENSDIVLVLVSADFIASEYCYSIEMKRAYDLHTDGKLVLIPVIIRYCDWHSAPFGSIQGLPKDARPVDAFSRHDEAYLQIATALREISEKRKGSSAQAVFDSLPTPSAVVQQSSRRSSNLRVRRAPTDLEKRNFLAQGFDTISQYILASAQELRERHDDIEVTSEAGPRELVLQIFLNGSMISQCKLWRSAEHGSETIKFSTGRITDNSWNGEYQIVSSNDQLGFRSMSMVFTGNREKILRAEDCAEDLWSEIMTPLQS